MKKLTFSVAIVLLLLIPMLSGCIGGGNDVVEPWEGEIEDLLFTTDDLGEGYEVETEMYDDPEEFADDVTDLNAHGFQEGAMADFRIFDWENMVIGAQMVLRFDAEKMDGLLEDFKTSIDEEDEDTTYEEIDLGDYGNDTLGLKLISSELEGLGAYAIGFIEQDIMVFIMVVSVDDDGNMVKSLAQTVLDKF